MPLRHTAASFNASGSPDLVLALLADARLPVGGHTQSAGVEPAMAQGLTSAEVPAFVAGRLRTVVAVEAGTAVVARHHVLAGADLRPVRLAWAARTPSGPLRTASENLGRGYLRLAGRLWPHPVWATFERTPPRPLVLGAIAAIAGLDAARLVRLCGHEDVATVSAAVLKLDPLDPLVTTGWVLAAHPLVEELVTRCASLTDPGEIPATSAPLVEQLSVQHSHAKQRLFHA
ncbi:urease accessory protein UreF [uncultured Pseudokineococcus sp.]|uniref:urease accessory protein UreF n=1 Tax=uncultured Pseudokineococcus sp. TaxID=1642928 RepID=UPI002624A34C|nr:urease accessory UreF family protein [uncultured Pseudokineococcus sp.]